jgi:uncharacterized membrane protein YcjF (UPF0283 family)
MKRPDGYTMLAIFAALIGGVLLLPMTHPEFQARNLATAGIHAGYALFTALAFVTAEALWGMRPWAYAATLALAASLVGAFVIGAIHGIVNGDYVLVMLLPMGALTAWGLQPVLRYVRDRGRLLHGAP